MAWLTKEEISRLGFGSVGENAFLSDKASYYGCSNIHIGNNVRIDDFCVLSAGDGGIEIGNFVHIAVFALLIGKGKITLGDFSGISSRVSIYSSNDDYSGEHLTNPTIPKKFLSVTHSNVTLGKHVIIGSGSVILPGVELGEGASIGALSLVKKSCPEFGVYAGFPVRKIGERSKKIIELEAQLLAEL